MNSLENLPAMLGTVFLAVMVGANDTWTGILVWVFAMSRRRLPPPNWLRAFEAAARHLSFTGAAHELGVSQAAVSQQVKLLEQQLEQRLFRRMARGLQLTDSGEAYLPAVRDGFERQCAGLGFSNFETSAGQLQVQNGRLFRISVYDKDGLGSGEQLSFEIIAGHRYCEQIH